MTLAQDALVVLDAVIAVVTVALVVVADVKQTVLMIAIATVLLGAAIVQVVV